MAKAAPVVPDDGEVVDVKRTNAGVLWMISAMLFPSSSGGLRRMKAGGGGGLRRLSPVAPVTCGEGKRGEEKRNMEGKRVGEK